MRRLLAIENNKIIIITVMKDCVDNVVQQLLLIRTNPAHAHSRGRPQKIS